MKNMKVSKKLILSFLIVIALAVIIGGVGIIGMVYINNNATEMYEHQTVPLPWMASVIEYTQELRFLSRDYVIAVAQEDLARIEAIRASTAALNDDITQNLNLFDSTIIRGEGHRAEFLFDEARDILYDQYFPFMDRVYELALAGDSLGILAEIGPIREPYLVILNNFREILTLRTAMAAEANASADAVFTMMLTIIIAALAVAIAAAVFLALYISGIISKPLTTATTYMKKAATLGDFTFSPEEKAAFDKNKTYKDEIGQLTAAISDCMDEIVHEIQYVEEMANGNLDINPNVLSEKDVLGNALSKMAVNLNRMFSDISTATAQVSTGSKQIADGSQSLAQGSTEQSASVQQLSSSIQEIASKTKGNAEMAERAATLGNTIKNNAEKGSTQMDEMMTAVKDINASSQNISKVIKSIDDIAFQTNILALNAAVEAARAGQHGKGFAVVAEEVRNLASKSAAAAKDTESLIADSIEKAELGSKIADDTAASLAEIVTGIGESSQLVGDIARSSEEQSEGIEQINKGIDQVAHVVQQNSATAEQSAAASQEMSGQSTVLEQLVSQFTLRGSGGQSSIPASSPAKELPAPTEAESDGSFGKY